MTAFHQVVESIPFVGSFVTPEKPKEPEIAYTDVDKDGRPIPQVFVFLTSEAFEDTQKAAAAMGYSALATHLKDRMDHGFQPVMTDEIRGDEEARAAWDRGEYNPNVFVGQTALALHWLIDEAARNPENPRVPGHLLSPRIFARMTELHSTTTPIEDIQAEVLPEAAKIAEAIQTQGPDESALVTSEGSLTQEKVTGGLDYDAMRSTDPNLKSVPHDTSV
jgi:hypothetical protein